MRPIRLTIEGVNSFTDEQVLDFDAVGRSDLFCICGKTGAGKTTIFDSIMLALYGKCGRGKLGEIVNLSRKTARVTFEFSEGGDVYFVERVITKKTEKDADNDLAAQGNTKEFTVKKNGEPIAAGGTAADVIAEVVGLDESEFKTVYLLEQGKYSDFLKLSPAEQNRAVGKIFSLMRFDEVSKRASAHKRDEESKADSIAAQIAELGDASADAMQAAKTELASLRAKNAALAKDLENRRKELETLGKARDEYIAADSKAKAVRQQEQQFAQARTDHDEAKRKHAEFLKSVESAADDAKNLDGLRAELNRLSALGALDREYKSATEDARQKRETSENISKQAADAAKAQKSLAESMEREFSQFEGELDKFKAIAEGMNCRSQNLNAVLESLFADEREKRIGAVTPALYTLADERKAWDALADQQKKHNEKLGAAKKAADVLLGKIERYGAELKAIAEQKAADQAAFTAAENALTAAQVNSHAAAVRGELSDGDICPVCGGKYIGGACGGGDTDVEKRKAERDKAKAELDKAEKREADGNKHIDIARSDYEREDKTIKECEADIADIQNKMKGLCVNAEAYDGLCAALAEAQKKGEKYKTLADESLKRASETAALAAQAQAAEKAAAEAVEKAEGYRARLGEACGKTDVEIARVKSEIDTLEAKLKSVEQKKKEFAAAEDAARAAAESLEKSLAAARADCPADLPEFDESAYQQKRDAETELTKAYAERDKEIAIKDAALAGLAEKNAKAVKLQAERSACLERAKLYDKIYAMTKGNAMLNYVAAEYIEEFTAAASDILSEMSGGKYAMSYDRSGGDKSAGFVVTDYLNGGKPRRTDTLSGGELFLASLAVAIAIARTQSKGNNAFFFLDEGFGTLDDDLIDTVYSALESLSKDCLVGVISHSNALIGLMPSCVTVEEATDVTGSRIRF